MMRFKGCIRIFIMYLCFGLMASLQSGTLRKEFKKTVTLGQDGYVAVKNTNGYIDVESWAGDEVEIVAEIEVKSGNRRDAERIMEEIEIEIDLSRDRLRIEPNYPKGVNKGGFFDWIFGRRTQVKVDFTLKVPEKCHLNLRSTNGRIKVADVEGDTDLSTTNGSILAEDMRGEVSASSTNGGISIELSEVNRNNDMTFHTTNGSITLFLPEDVSAEVSASTVNGSIRTDFPLEIRGKYNSKRLSGRIGVGDGAIRLKTVNGSIQIREY